MLESRGTVSTDAALAQPPDGGRYNEHLASLDFDGNVLKAVPWTDWSINGLLAPVPPQTMVPTPHRFA